MISRTTCDSRLRLLVVTTVFSRDTATRGKCLYQSLVEDHLSIEAAGGLLFSSSDFLVSGRWLSTDGQRR